MENKLVYDIHDKPPFGKMIIFALQQLLAIIAAMQEVYFVSKTDKTTY